MPQRCDVVITGIGAVTSIGVGTDAFWNRLCEGASGIRPLPWANGGSGGETIGGLLVDFDPKAHVRPRKALKVMCRELQTAFAASLMAVRQAGLEDAVQQQQLDRHRYGTVFGAEMMYGPAEELVDAYRRCVNASGSMSPADFGQAAMRDLYPLWMLKYLPNMAACHVGIAVQAYGPNNTLVMGDTSGPAAVIEAAAVIARGTADAMLSGATGTRISETRILYRGDLPRASCRQPLSASSRPFAHDRDGVVGAEAAAAVMLESASLAARRGARPLARLRGHAVRFAAAPGTRGSTVAIAGAIRGALRAADCAADDVTLVVSHAMGDAQQDAAEHDALLQSVPRAAVTAPIAALGHSGAAAGTLELATAVLALDRGVIPPTVNADAVPADFALDLVAQQRPLTGELVLVITHTSAGHATAIILDRP